MPNCLQSAFAAAAERGPALGRRVSGRVRVACSGWRIWFHRRSDGWKLFFWLDKQRLAKPKTLNSVPALNSLRVYRYVLFKIKADTAVVLGTVLGVSLARILYFGVCRLLFNNRTDVHH